jgi:tetratricopeptide (TPR) repeat protein
MNHDLTIPRRRAVLRVALVAAASSVGAGWVALAGSPACAAEAAAFDAAFALFQRAMAGDDDAIDSAAKQFAALAAAEPGDPMLLAYSGAATALQARAAILPWKKMSYADEGLARLDKALALLQPEHDAPSHRKTPASLETRFVAASTFLGMPGMFNRRARGQRLLDEVLQSPLFAVAPLPFRGNVWLRAGAAAAADNRPTDARRWYEQVVSSGAPQAGTAQARLKELAS